MLKRWKRVAAAIGVFDAQRPEANRRLYLAQGQFQLAEIAGGDGGVLPVFLARRASPVAARIGSRASPSRPSARKRKPASFISQA